MSLVCQRSGRTELKIMMWKSSMIANIIIALVIGLIIFYMMVKALVE